MNKKEAATLEMDYEKVEANLNTHGFCCVCDNLSEFHAGESQWGHVRESMNCGFCGSSSRKRHVIKTILEIFAPQYKALGQAQQSLRHLSIYSAASNEQLQSFLGDDNPNFVCSEYFPGVKEGDVKNGIMCQNIERLTFNNEQFDLVITEDVFEHIRRPWKAFEEVSRVLKPGGCHVFTIPFSFYSKTVTRVDTSTDQDAYVLPPTYHIDSLRDKVLVYTDFGYDIFDKLTMLGFETHMTFSLYRDAIKYGIADSYVFVSRKLRSLT
jgi:SAM-dependent methyltransferase